MGFIKAKKVKGIEKPKDSTSAGGTLPSGVYPYKITNAYAVLSDKSDWQGMMLELEINGRKISNMFGITGADGEIYSENNGKKRYRAGYLLADALTNIATEGELGILDLETEEKVVKKKVDGKDQNVTVDTFVDLIGTTGQVGIIATKRFKQNKVDGEWLDTDEVITTAEFHTFFDDEGFTVNELESEAEEPAFIEEWKKAWEGKERDFAKAKESKGSRKSTGDSDSAGQRGARSRGLVRRK